ncbi:MAG: DUF2799 domain-containing protein [Pikeienuella sp.]
MILSLIGALSLAACATTTASLGPDQCRTDWRAVGYADGADGEPVSRIGAYRDACARGGAALSEADEAAWIDGWSAAAGTRPPSEGRAQADDPAEDDRGGDPLYPRIYPTIGVGIGSGGVSVGGGIGIGLGSFSLGIY